MNKQIMFEVEKVLKQKKVDASFKAKENASLALQNNEIQKLDSRRRELIVLSATALFEQKDATALKTELQEVGKAQNELLKKYKLTIADFSPKTECELCNDTGYLKGKVCSCAKKIASKLLLEKSGFQRELASFEQSDFDLFGENCENIKLLYNKMQQWVNKPQSDIKTILFYGATGTGKTFLTECMASALIDQGNFVFFTTSFNLVQTCLKFHTSFAEEKSGMLDSFLESDVLFIDDLGTEPMMKNVTQEYLLMILNERMANNKRTVISTNLYLEQIEERFDERVFSRIFNKRSGVAFKMDGCDLRFKKSTKK